MIDDSIKLPESKTPDKTEVVTEEGIFPPNCPLIEVFGGEDIWRDILLCVGSRFSTSARFQRFKLLEHTPEHIIEHFIVRDSADEWMYPLWTSKVDRRTIKTEKFYNLKALAAVHQILGGNGEPLEDIVKRRLGRSIMLGNEWSILFDRFIPSGKYIVPLNRVDNYIDSMIALHLNADLFDSCLEENDLDISADAVFHGIHPQWMGAVVQTASSRAIASQDRFKMDDLKAYMSPLSRFHPMSMYCSKQRNGDIEPSDGDMCNAWFDVLKYAELIPYGEFCIRKRDDQTTSMWVHDPYNRPRRFSVNIAEDEKICQSVDHITTIIASMTGMSNWILFRSWDEEVYITLSTSQSKTGCRPFVRRMYFDLMYAAIGSRALSGDFVG